MTLPEAVSNRLIGALFVERGLVSQSQLVVALELQQETGQQLGQILVERFGVERSELAKVVAEHWARMGEAKEDVSTRASESWRQLGEILVSRGFVTREQLVQALERQRLTGERLGEALVGQGVISKFELAGSLAEQASLADTPAEPEGEPAPVVQLTPRFDAPSEPEAVEPAAVEPEVESEPSRPREPRPAVELILESVSGRPDIEPELEPHEEAGLAALYEVPSEPAPEIEYVPEVALVPPYEEPVVPVPVPEIELEPTIGEIEPAGPEREVELVAAHDEAPTLAAGLCVAFASTPRGYRLVELENGRVPDVGERVELPEVGELVVLRRGASPLPADERPCVFLEPLVPATA
jgi:hypothetical protein